MPGLGFMQPSGGLTHRKPVNVSVKERKRGSPAPCLPATENQKVLVQDLGAASAKESLGSVETGGSFQAREEGS